LDNKVFDVIGARYDHGVHFLYLPFYITKLSGILYAYHFLESLIFWLFKT